MAKFKPYRKKQTMLLPPSLEDYVPLSHLARVVDEVVEALDTKEIEDKYSDLGQNTYHPKIQLKLLFYGYATGNRSGRKIAQMCESDTAYIYLAQMYRPDFRTINDFRKNNLYQIKDYFVEVVRMCKGLGMVKMGEISIDGTKIKANAAKRRTKDKKGYERWLEGIEERIQKILQEAGEIEEEEDRLYGKDKRGDELPEEIRTKDKLRKKIKEVMETLNTEKEKRNLTDPDARFMRDGRGRIDINYNGQIAVSQDQVILAAEVINEPNDRGALKEILEQAEANIGEEMEEVIADSGYSSYDDYEYLQKEGKTGYIPDQYLDEIKQGEYQKEENRYHLENFIYDKEKGIYICPEGKELRFYKRRDSESGKRKRRGDIYRGIGCGECGVRELCTKQKARTIWREERRELLEDMRKRLLSEEGKAKYKKRLYTVEPPFGNLKHNLGYRSFLLRGLEKVDGEFKLMCIGHNLKKMYFVWRSKDGDGQKGRVNNKMRVFTHIKEGISFLISIPRKLFFDLHCFEGI
jgi:transposase